MDVETRVMINNLTQDIIDYYSIEIPITDMSDVVEKKMGGRIEETTRIEELADGSVEKAGDNFIIKVSPFQSEERKRFTIAHELGHLFLHMGYKTNQKIWDSQKERHYYRSGSSLIEYQANEFAAALLMPRKKYLEILDDYTENSIVDTPEVAEYFGVSVSAASNRGKFLGYLKW